FFIFFYRRGAEDAETTQRGLPRLQPDRTEQAGGEGLHLVHVLWLEALSVAEIKKTIIGKPAPGHVIQRRVRNHYSDLVITGSEKTGDVQRIRRTPNRAGSSLIDVYHC